MGMIGGLADAPTWQVVLVNSIAWFFIHIGISLVCVRADETWIDPGRWLYRTRAWERGGAIYRRLFAVHKWKRLLPAGGASVPGGFSMRRLESRRSDYLQRWVLETCRAELTHCLALAASALFFLWNPFWLGWIMVAYAIVVNVPCIITQRYNRPWLQRLAAKSHAARLRRRVAAGVS